ncbi:MAG: hypothetical protein JNG88_08720 [Phycisphaerales bacterium]|nr:hypothetical protein [Phycisphaerales bacterium]
MVARGASSASGLSAAASVALAAVSLVAMWKVTSPDPSGLGEESQFNARSIVRFVTGASFAVTVAVLLMSLISANPVMFMVIALLGFANSLMVVIAEWYKYKLYEYLASRIPDRMMISRARTIRWIGVIFLLIGVIAGVLGMVVLRPPAGGMAPTMAGAGIALIIIGAVGGLGLLVYAVMGVFYLFRLRKGINEQLRMAEMIWSTAPLARAAGSPPSPL